VKTPRKPAPVLVLEVTLEEPPRVTIRAVSHEDELRLRHWLRRAGAVNRLAEAVRAALVELDQRDAWKRSR
jgi:hypothetical protein